MHSHAALGGRASDAARPWAAPLSSPPQVQQRSRLAAAAQPSSSTRSSSLKWQLRAAAGDAQPGLPPSDPAAESAACLAAAGVDLAQLAGEQPEAAAQLAADPALAQLLVAVVDARRGLRDNGRNVTPADLAARLVFLVAEAGLPAAEVQRVYARRPRTLSFMPETARAALTWLRPHFPDPARLQRLGIQYASVWHTSVPVLEASKVALQQVFSLSDAAWADTVYGMPALLVIKLDTVRSVVDWLQSPAVGLAMADVLRLFGRRPGLFYLSAGSLSAKLEWLLGRLQLPRDKAATLMKQGASFNASERLLESRVAALEAYGFTAADVVTLALASGVLLTCGFDKKIWPTLEELERLLGPFASPEEARHTVVSVARKGSGLITCAPAKLRGNYDFLLAQGLSTDEAKGLLRAAPQVWKQTLSGATVAAKLRYYDEVLWLSARDMLLLHRGYLKEGLEKVDRRVFCMERRGQRHWLREGGTLSWACDSPAAFRARYGISEEEWAASETAWPASERAQVYGLAGQQRQRGFSIDQALASARLREANARCSREASERRGGGSA